MSDIYTAYFSIDFKLSHAVSNVRVPVHVSVNVRKYYRVYLTTLLRCESKSCRAVSSGSSESNGPARSARTELCWE